jgi:hypothetical protein
MCSGRRIYEPKMEEVKKGNGENYIMRSIVIGTPHQISVG